MSKNTPMKQHDRQQKQIDTNRWVDVYGDILYRYALARVSDTTKAEDLVQDTFVAALQAKDSFKGQSTEKTWLIGILKHKILDHYRKSNRGMNKILESDGDIDRMYNEKGFWNNPVLGWKKTPDKNLDRKQFLVVLKKCINALPEGQKNVFCLRELDDLSGEEICKSLKITSTNLWVMLHRARHRLRNCLTTNWFSTEKL